MSRRFTSSAEARNQTYGGGRGGGQLNFIVIIRLNLRIKFIGGRN